MGSERFNKMQYGEESTKGTPVAATNMWIGQMEPIKSDSKPKYPKEHFGMRAESFRSIIHQRLNLDTFKVEDGCFQHLLLPFGIGVKGNVTPVEQTTDQDDYLWDFSPSMTAANNPDSATIRKGDDVQAWISEYCMAERIRISGTVGQGAEPSPVSIEWDYFGRKLVEGSFTNDIAIPNLEPLNAKLARLYWDNLWADVGETELPNILRTFDFEILTGVHPVFAGAADKTFNRHKEGLMAIMATFGFEAGSEANDILEAQQNGTFKVASFTIPGAQIGSGDPHSFTLNFGGTFEDAQPISGEDRADNLATAVLHGYLDKTSSLLFQAMVTTDRNTY